MNPDALDLAAEAVRRLAGERPWPLAIVTGSGLKGLASIMRVERTLPADAIPGMPRPTIEGHSSQVFFGRIGRMGAILFAGRVHFYEGRDYSEVVFGLRLAARLGARCALVTNASGGISEWARPGDLVSIRDHARVGLPGRLLMRGEQALAASDGSSIERYDAILAKLLQHAARLEKIDLKEGIYGGTLGPAYETKAEIDLLRLAGADIVGMSTVAEVLAARRAGLRVAAISCVTNRVPTWGIVKRLTHEEVVETSAAAIDKMKRLIARWVNEMGAVE